jgi:hypothetical protein
MPFRGIVLASFLGAALLLAACTPPMPPDVLAARAESQIVCGSGNVDVATPVEFTGAMTTVGDALSSVCPDQTVTEVPFDSAAPVAVVASTPSAQDITDFKTASCPNDSVIVIPAFAYPVSLAYNVVGLEGLVFTPEAVAGVLAGSVTSWEDPLIADANPDFDLAGLPEITLMSVESPQGPLDGGEKFAAEDEMVLEMSAIEGSMAVLPVFVAFNNVLATANLPVKGTDANGVDVDTVITADDVQLYKVGSGATTVTTDETGNIFASPAVGGFPVEGNFDLASSKIVLGSDQALVGWPVEGYAHLLICDDGANDSLPLLFAQYMVRLAGQGSLEIFGVTPLPEPIRVQTFTPLRVTVMTGEEGDAPDMAPIEEQIVDEEADSNELPQDAEVTAP